MCVQDFEKSYKMIGVDERNAIIERIHRKELCSETVTGQQEEWWLKKHHPDNEIPRNIYLLGQGTINELYTKYQITYGLIEWNLFINYTREMIKQKIMV